MSCRAISQLAEHPKSLRILEYKLRRNRAGSGWGVFSVKTPGRRLGSWVRPSNPATAGKVAPLSLSPRFFGNIIPETLVQKDR